MKITRIVLFVCVLSLAPAFAQITSPGGSGGGSGTVSGTVNNIGKFTASTTIGNSACTEDGSFFSCSVPFKNTAANGGIDFTEGTGAGLSAATSHCIFYADSTAHVMKVNCNNGTTKFVPGIATAGTSGNCVKLAANGIDIVDNGSACGGGSAIVAIPLNQQGGVSQALAANTTYYLRAPGGGNPATSSTATSIQIPNPVSGTLAEMYCTAGISASTGNAGDTFNLVLEYDSANDGSFSTAALTATSTSLSSSANFITASVTGGATSITAGRRFRLKLVTPAAWIGTTPTLSNVSCVAKVTGAS
jgi:hypothetical protein